MSGKSDVEIVYGLRAVQAVCAVRPRDVVRVAHARELHDAVTGVPLIEMSESELERAAGSTHHEGIVAKTKPREWLAPNGLADLLSKTRGVAIALDRVRNPYNVGSILRSAAFLGADAVILGAPAPHPALAPDAVRVAEGGAERLRLVRTTDLAETLGRLRGRIQIVGAEGEAPAKLKDFSFRKPCIVVVGHEREGLLARVRAQCDALVSIEGTGSVDSLNVGVAAGILLWSALG